MTTTLLLLLLAADPVDFARDVQPILEARCYQCHAVEYKGKARKPKGDLRLDSLELILRGSGGKKPVVVAGHPEKSELMRRIALPGDHEDVMPPDGETLPEAERDILRRWIAEAAPKQAQPSANDPFALWRSVGQGVAAAPQAAIDAAAKATGARFEPLFDGSPLLRVDFIAEPARGDDKAIVALAALRRNIAILSLADTKVTDSSIAEIAKMPALLRLDLQRTAVTDKGVRALGTSGPPELRRLNLYGTAVTDAGVAALAGLARLESLFLWESKVTEKGAAALRAALPGCNIRLDRDLPEPEGPRNPDANPGRRRNK